MDLKGYKYWLIRNRKDLIDVKVLKYLEIGVMDDGL